MNNFLLGSLIYAGTAILFPCCENVAQKCKQRGRVGFFDNMEAMCSYVGKIGVR